MPPALGTPCLNLDNRSFAYIVGLSLWNRPSLQSAPLSSLVASPHLCLTSNPALYLWVKTTGSASERLMLREAFLDGQLQSYNIAGLVYVLTIWSSRYGPRAVRRRHCVGSGGSGAPVNFGRRRRRAEAAKNIFLRFPKKIVLSSTFSDDLLVISKIAKKICSNNGIGGAPINYRWRRADQQKSAAALQNCRRQRLGAAGARLYMDLITDWFSAQFLMPCASESTARRQFINSWAP